MNLQERCKKKGASYSTVRVYKSQGYSTEDAIKRAIKNSLDNTLSAKIRKANLEVNMHTVLVYANKHPELSHEEIIEYYKNKPIPFKELCKQEGVSYGSLKPYRKQYKELTDRLVILKYKKEHSEKTFSDKCREKGIDPSRGLGYKHTHKNLSDDEVIQVLLNLDTTESFASKCKKRGLNRHLVADFRRRNSKLNLTDEQIINLYLEKQKERDKEKAFKLKCEEFGLNYKTVIRYRYKHSDLTDDEVLQYYLQGKEESWADICKKYNVLYSSFNSYYFHHKDLTKAECLLHFRPDLKVNLFGEIVGY